MTYLVAQHAPQQGITDSARKSAPRFQVLDEALSAALKLPAQSPDGSKIAIVTDDGTSTGAPIDPKEFAKADPALKAAVKQRRISVGLVNGL